MNSHLIRLNFARRESFAEQLTDMMPLGIPAEERSKCIDVAVMQWQVINGMWIPGYPVNVRITRIDGLWRVWISFGFGA